MKLAIRILAALLALSSTALAEDWNTLDTLPNLPEGRSILIFPRYDQISVPTSRERDEFLLPDAYDALLSAGAIIPPSIIRANLSATTTTSGIPVPNGAFLSARCVANYDLGQTVSAPDGSSERTFILSEATCPGVLGGIYNIPISAFARSDTVSAMAANVAALEQRILALETLPQQIAEWDAEMQAARRQADEGSAMAAAMTTVAPADGKANRIGFNTATYNGSTAVAVSYSRAAGDVDFNVGVAMAGENAMVKAGAGFSW